MWGTFLVSIVHCSMNLAGIQSEMSRQKDLVRIHAAAIYFAATTQDVDEIASTFKVSPRTIRRWASEEPEWERAVNLWDAVVDCNRNGNGFHKKPKRDPSRDSAEIFDQAKKVYQKAINDGVPFRKLAKFTAQKVGQGLTRRRVYEWAKAYRWQDRNGSWGRTITTK